MRRVFAAQIPLSHNFIVDLGIGPCPVKQNINVIDLRAECWFLGENKPLILKDGFVAVELGLQES